MGLGLREVAADVVCTLGMEEDEGTRLMPLSAAGRIARTPANEELA